MQCGRVGHVGAQRARSAENVLRRCSSWRLLRPASARGAAPPLAQPLRHSSSACSAPGCCRRKGGTPGCCISLVTCVAAHTVGMRASKAGSLLVQHTVGTEPPWSRPLWGQQGGQSARVWSACEACTCAGAPAGVCPASRPAPPHHWIQALRQQLVALGIGVQHVGHEVGADGSVVGGQEALGAAGQCDVWGERWGSMGGHGGDRGEGARARGGLAAASACHCLLAGQGVLRLTAADGRLAAACWARSLLPRQRQARGGHGLRPLGTALTSPGSAGGRPAG